MVSPGQVDRAVFLRGEGAIKERSRRRKTKVLIVPAPLRGAGEDFDLLHPSVGLSIYHHQAEDTESRD